MAYDISLVQVNTNVGGMGVANTDMGFGTDPFNYLVFSMWTCLPTYPGRPEFGSNGGPAYIFLFTLNAAGETAGGTQLRLGNQSDHVFFFDGVFATPIVNVRSHHLVSVNCVTQTVQYYVNDNPMPLISGGWVSTNTFRALPSINIWDFDIGSSLGLTFPAYADLWLGKTPGFVDLSIKSNRRKFINHDLTAVSLGADGSVPFGFTPQIFQTILPGDTPDAFLQNRGLGIDFNMGGSTTFSFQTPDKCTLAPRPSPPVWAITSELP